jgi:thiamine monophosphate kinase
MRAAERAGAPVACIGRVEKGAGVVLIGANGLELAVPKAGFTHF